MITAVEYMAPGPVSEDFLFDDSFFRGLMGPFGSGKSTACIFEILRRAQEQRKGSDGKRRSRWGGGWMLARRCTTSKPMTSIWK